MSDESNEDNVESVTESDQIDSGSVSDNGDEEGDDNPVNTSENANKNPAKNPKVATPLKKGFKENIGGYNKYFSQSYEPKEWQDGQADREFYLRNGADGGFTANFSLWLNPDPGSGETGSFTARTDIVGKTITNTYVVTLTEETPNIDGEPRIYIIPKRTKLDNVGVTKTGEKATASVETTSDIMIKCDGNEITIFQSSILNTGNEKHLSFLKQYDNKTHRITKIIGKKKNIIFEDLAKLIHEDSFLNPFEECKFYYCSVYGSKTFEKEWAKLIMENKEIQITLAESLSAIILNKNGVDKSLSTIEGFFVRLQLKEGNIADDDVKSVKVDIGVKTIQQNQAALTSDYITYFKGILTPDNIESIKKVLMNKITNESIEPLVQFRTLASDGFQWTFDECCKILKLYENHKNDDAVKPAILKAFKKIFKGNEENANLALCANMKKIAEDINNINGFNIADAPIKALPLQLTYNNTDKILESEKTNLVQDQVGQIEKNVQDVLFSDHPVAQILLNVPGLDTDGKSIAAVCAVKKLYPHQARVFALARLRALSSSTEGTDLFKKGLKKNDVDTIFQGSGLLANHDTGSGKTLTSISIVLAFWDTLWKDENNEEQPWGCFIMSTANGVRFDNNIDKLSKLVIDYFGFYKVHYYPTWDHDNKLIGWTYHDPKSGAAIFSEQYYNDNFKPKEKPQTELPFKSFQGMVAWLIQERMIIGTKATLLSPVVEGDEDKVMKKAARDAFINRRLKTIQNDRPKSILMEFSKFGYDVKKNSPEEEVKAKQMQLAVRNNIQNLAERQSELHNKIVVPFIKEFIKKLEKSTVNLFDPELPIIRSKKAAKSARTLAFQTRPALFLPEDNTEQSLETYYESYLKKDDKEKNTCIENLYALFLSWFDRKFNAHSKIENIKQLYFRVLLNEAGNVHKARLIALNRQLNPLPVSKPRNATAKEKEELQKAYENRLQDEREIVEDIKADIRLCYDMICKFLDKMNFPELHNGYKDIKEELTPINTETTEGEDIDNKPSATADSEEDDDDDEDAINDATTNAEKAPKTPIHKPNYLRMGGTDQEQLKHCVFILDEIHILAENEMLVNYNYAIDAMKNHRDPATTWVVGLTATPGNTSKDAGEIFDMICTGTTFSKAAAKQKKDKETDPLITAIDEELKNTLYISRASFLGTESPGFPKLEFEKHGILSTYAGCPMTKKLFIAAFLKRYERIKIFETGIEPKGDNPGKEPYVSSVGTNDDNRTAWLDFYSSFGKVYQTPTNDGKQKFLHTRESKTIGGDGKLYELNENKKMAFFRHTNLYIEQPSDAFKENKPKKSSQQTPEQNYDTPFVTTLQSPVFKFMSASNTKYFIPTSKLLKVLDDILKHEFNSGDYIKLWYYNFQEGRKKNKENEENEKDTKKSQGDTFDNIKTYVRGNGFLRRNGEQAEVLKTETKNAIIIRVIGTLIKLLEFQFQYLQIEEIAKVIESLEILAKMNTFAPFKDEDKSIFLLNTLSNFYTNAKEQQVSEFSITLLTALTKTIKLEADDAKKIEALTTALKVDEAQMQEIQEQIQSRIDNAAREKALKENEIRTRNENYLESIKDSRMDSFEKEDNKFETKQRLERNADEKNKCKPPTGKTYVYSSQIRAMQALALYLQHCSKHKLMFITSDDTNIDDIIRARNNHGIRYILFRGFTNSIVYPFKKCNPLKNSDAKNLHDNLMDSSKTYRDIKATVCPTGYSLDDYVNIDGELAPIVLATKTAFTGVDLKGISRLLLMDSFLNKIHLLQFIGRGPRLCSHANTKGKKVSLKCYFMQTVGEKGNTDDDETAYAGVISDDDTTAAVTKQINQYWTQELGYNSDTFLWNEAVANYNAFLNPYGQAVREAALDSVNLPDQTHLNSYLETNPTAYTTTPPPQQIDDKSGLILDYLRQNDLVFEPYFNQLKKLKVDEETINAFKKIKTELAEHLRKEITTEKCSVENELTALNVQKCIQKIRTEKLRDIMHSNDQHPKVLEIIFAQFMTQPVVTEEQKPTIDKIFETVIEQDVNQPDKPAFEDLKNKIKGEIGTEKTQNRHVKVSFNIGPNEGWSGNTATLTKFLTALKKIGITNNFKKGGDKSISQSSVDLTFDTPSLKDDTTVVVEGSEESVDDST